MADLLTDARKYKRRAVEQLLAQHYPMVHRVATGLTGREDVARGVIRFVYSRAIRILPQWQIDSAPQQWFLHHTILTVRRAAKHQPSAQEDTLVGRGPAAEYVAFIKALRSLPQQQEEAFVLTHGERLEARQVGVAMDCSMQAAGNHLRAAEESLKSIGGEAYGAMVERMGETYRAATPEEALILPRIRGEYSRFLWPKRVKRFLLLVVLGAIGVAIWWVWFKK